MLCLNYLGNLVAVTKWCHHTAPVDQRSHVIRWRSLLRQAANADTARLAEGGLQLQFLRHSDVMSHEVAWRGVRRMQCDRNQSLED